MASHARSSPSAPVSILFVCLGNICRSPLAEGVFASLAEEEGVGHRFRVDSAGTGAWHVGEPADPRSVAVARDHGIQLTGRARRVGPADLRDFDWVIAMDRANARDLEALAEPGAGARIHLLREFDPDGAGGDVPDPYYGGDGGFERVFSMVERSCRGLLGHLLDHNPDAGSADAGPVGPGPG